MPRFERTMLVAGLSIPLVYYGIQLAAWPGYPGYDVTRQVASDLGGPGSRWAGLFNVGILAVGLLTLIGAAGQVVSFRRTGTPLALAILAGLSMAAFGVATLLAGAYPLPDPRHASGSPLLAAALAYPMLMLAVFWRSPVWRGVFAVCSLTILVAALTLSEVIPVDGGRWGGLLQRPVALALIGPMALASWAMLRRRR